MIVRINCVQNVNVKKQQTEKPDRRISFGLAVSADVHVFFSVFSVILFFWSEFYVLIGLQVFFGPILFTKR